MSRVPVDVDLSEKVEGHRILVQYPSFDLRVRPGFLSSELIAGESRNSQPLSLVSCVQSLKLVVVGVSQTSVGGHIQYYHHLASVLIKTDGISVDVIRLKVVNGIPSDRRQ